MRTIPQRSKMSAVLTAALFTGVLALGVTACGESSDDGAGDGEAASDTVRDEQTGALWQAALTDGVTHTAAAQVCDDLDLEGHDDWRLPSKGEVVGLLDNCEDAVAAGVGRCDSCTDSVRCNALFGTASAEVLWTAADGAEGVNIVVDLSGEVREAADTTVASARCIRL